MGDVADVFEDVFDAAYGLVEDVVGTVVTLVSGMIDILMQPEVLLLTLIVIAVITMQPEIVGAYASAASTEMAAYSVAMSTTDVMIVGTSAFTSAVSAGLAAFAEAIHLTLLLEINTIAMLVSEDYRNMMSGVYAQMGAVSVALGFYPQFLALAIRNSRNVVLSTSNLLGRKYDLAEVRWLVTFNDYLTEFNKKAKTYERNPGALFYDLEQLIERPAMDASGSAMQTVFISISDTLKAVEATVQDTMTVRDDLDRLIYDLPEKIQSQIKPYTDPIIKQFDDFIRQTYDPAITQFQSLLDKFSDLQGKNISDLEGVVGRLAKPGDYLLEIDSLLGADRLDQEGKIADISSRTYREDITKYIDYNKVILEDLETESKVPYPSVPPPVLLTLEPTEPTTLPPERITRIDTWFVGDY